MIHAMLVRPFREKDLDRFPDIEGYRFTYCSEPEPGDLTETEVILGQPRFRQMQAAPHLAWVQVTSAGVDHYLRRRIDCRRGLS